MSGELQDIFDELVLIQEAITPPSGLKAVKSYDEPPGGVTTFPCFVNVEAEIDEIVRAVGLRTMKFSIDMHLLFCRTDQKYNVRERRQWVKKVIDGFDDAIRLNNNQSPVQYAPIESVVFDNELELPGAARGGGAPTYVAATFRIRPWLAEAFTFGA